MTTAQIRGLRTYRQGFADGMTGRGSAFDSGIGAVNAPYREGFNAGWDQAAADGKDLSPLVILSVVR